VELRASSLASLPPAQRDKFLATLSADELEFIEHDWQFWARDDQLSPPGLWRIWLALAGRGWGKTRVGAEWCHEYALQNAGARIAIVAATKEDAEKVCVAGDSGILATQKPWFKCEFKPAKNGGTVFWPNGSLAELYSGDNPQSLRGPQFHAAWCDELLKWRRMQAAWDMLRMGLRLGQDPRTVITTTPTPAKMLRDLMADERKGRDGSPLVRITRGSTFANAANLAEDFLDELRKKYLGTRLGRQELEAEILTDKPGALWTLGRIDEHRVDPDKVPDLERIVVAIDPPVTSGENADECGIIAAGRAKGHAYVLEDASERGLSPKQWAEKAIGVFVTRGADCIVAEANQGGEMITQVIKNIDPRIPVKLVYATRGKVVRAEPVSNLYEQGRVHHAGYFKALEDQMCLAAGTLVETASGEVPIESVARGDLVMTRAGLRPVKIARETGCSSVFVVIETTDGRTLRCTPNHPILNADTQQFVPASSVQVGMRLSARPSMASMAVPSRGEAAGTIACVPATIGTPRANCSTEQYGKPIVGRSRMGTTSITSMATQAITDWATFGVSLLKSMWEAMILVVSSPLATNGAASALRRIGRSGCCMPSPAPTAGNQGAPRTRTAASSAIWNASAGSNLPNSLSSAPVRSVERATPHATRGECIAVRSVATLHTSPESVFNLEVVGEHEFFANGILTHNCDFTTDFDRKTAGYSPDRLDALVWAITELMLGVPAAKPKIWSL